MSNIDVVYTPWENLKKTGDMAIEQIGFKDDEKVKKTERREEIDYRGEREERDAKERQKAKEKQREEKAREQLELEEKERQRQIRSYDGVFTEDKMHSNYDGGNDSDDFM